MDDDTIAQLQRVQRWIEGGTAAVSDAGFPVTSAFVKAAAQLAEIEATMPDDLRRRIASAVILNEGAFAQSMAQLLTTWEANAEGREA